MRFKRPRMAVLGGFGTGLFLLLALSAWMQIQALRLSYRCQSVRKEIEAVDRRRNGLAHRRTLALSLARLDNLARAKYFLQVPNPVQVRLLADPA